MGFFEDDPFEDIVREFFGQSGPPRGRYKRETIVSGEDEERVIDFIEDDNYAYFIFELPGYTEEDISINMKGNTIELIAKKKDVDGIKEYLAQKLSRGMKYSRSLPAFVDPKKFVYALKNGILEIKFEKRKK